MLDHDFLSKFLGQVVGERQDDLRCYGCGEYGDTLILKLGTIRMAIHFRVKILL
jgi:hypothetical protein